MKGYGKRPTKDIARARKLHREFVRLDREVIALYNKQDRVMEKRRKAATRYAIAKQAVDALMFARKLGPSKLPKASWY